MARSSKDSKSFFVKAFKYIPDNGAKGRNNFKTWVSVVAPISVIQPFSTAPTKNLVVIY
jgi:hypothetical protein